METSTSSYEIGERTCLHCGAEKRAEALSLFGMNRTVWIADCGCQEKIDAANEDRERREQSEARRRRDEESIQRKYRDAGILRGMMGSTFAGWKPRPEVAEAYLTVKTYAENLQSHLRMGDGLLLSGKPGTGKTHLATAVVHHALELGVEAMIVNSTDLLRSLRPSAPEPEKTEEKYRTIDLLVIDDLGKEKFSEWVEEVIYHLVNYRLNDLRATIITTNLGQVELNERVGQATVDRILQMCAPLRMDAESMRQRIRREREIRVVK